MVHRVPVVGRRLGEGLGALREREYRLLFGATLTTSVGGAVGTIALAFAVLDVAGATSLGIVIAVRQGASAAVLVFGGVLSDRARRNLVLVGASLVQGAAQAATAAIVLAGVATARRARRPVGSGGRAGRPGRGGARATDREPGATAAGGSA